MPKEASIIIVNYNGERYLRKLFDSIASQTCKDFEVILVDNASKDSSLKIAEERKDLPLKIVKNSKNEGFCIANNQAAELSTSNFLVFLNNDTYVDPDWLKNLIKSGNADPNNVIVVSSILNPSSREIVEGPMQYDVYGAALGLDKQNFFYGTGASMLVTTNFFKVTGFFDSKFFMYQEDVDLCWRARVLGFNVVYAPDSLCYHLSQAGNFEDLLLMPSWKFYHAHCKNRMRMIIKNYSSKKIAKILPLSTLFVFSRALLMSAVTKRAVYIQFFFKGFFWNLRNLKNTLMERYHIQRLRRASDKAVLKFMLPYSVELSSIKLLISNRKALG